MQYLFLIAGLPQWSLPVDSTAEKNGFDASTRWIDVAEHCKAAETRVSAIVQHYAKPGEAGSVPEKLDATETAIQQFCLDVRLVPAYPGASSGTSGIADV